MNSHSSNMWSDCKMYGSGNEIQPYNMPLHNDSSISHMPLSNGNSMPMPLTYIHGSRNEHDQNSPVLIYPVQSNNQFEQRNNIGDFPLINYQAQCSVHQYSEDFCVMFISTYYIRSLYFNLFYRQPDVFYT